ncbi:unnamed protein product [Chilo suppressalis]|uniref:Cathepsin propeptide inhibitor domain-containing protein n=1 Tax=Chilo suppressalis TaxID=168631 RepID=A0ABN8L101_CHISP|nr:unnamed protein product [Chilo suppressalis]
MQCWSNMKLVNVVLLVCAVAMASAAPADEPRHYDLNNAPAIFEQFIKDHNRSYKDEDDKKAHYEAFVKNLHTINESNKKNPTATYGINKFADYTAEERKSMFGLRKE